MVREVSNQERYSNKENNTLIRKIEQNKFRESNNIEIIIGIVQECKGLSYEIMDLWQVESWLSG